MFRIDGIYEPQPDWPVQAASTRTILLVLTLLIATIAAGMFVLAIVVPSVGAAGGCGGG
jgi:hypothetical protein